MFISQLAAYHYARNALKGADAYIANFSSTAKDLANAGIPKGKITVLAPVIDLKTMPKPAKKQPVVIYAGRLIKEKRLDLWIDAVAKAHKLNAEIKGLIVGSGPEEAAVKKMIKPYSFIKMKRPYSSKAQLYSAIGKSMAMLNMSEREGLSVIAIESAALGTAPVLPDYTPIPDEVKELSIVRDADSIPYAIADIASDRIKYKANKQKLERFDVKKVGRAFERLLAL